MRAVHVRYQLKLDSRTNHPDLVAISKESLPSGADDKQAVSLKDKEPDSLIAYDSLMHDSLMHICIIIFFDSVVWETNDGDLARIFCERAGLTPSLGSESQSAPNLSVQTKSHSILPRNRSAIISGNQNRTLRITLDLRSP